MTAGTGEFQGDQALLTGVGQRSRIEGHVQGAGEVGGGTAVGAAQEAVALQTLDVAPNGHLRAPEVTGQLGDLVQGALGAWGEDVRASKYPSDAESYH